MRIKKIFIVLSLVSLYVSAFSQEKWATKLTKQNVLAYSYAQINEMYSYYDFKEYRQITVKPNSSDTIKHLAGIGGPFSHLSPNGEYLVFASNFNSIIVSSVKSDSIFLRHTVPEEYRVLKGQWNPNGNSVIFLQGNAEKSELVEMFISTGKSRVIKEMKFGDVFMHCNFSYNQKGNLIAIDVPENKKWETIIFDTIGVEQMTFPGMFFGWLNSNDEIIIAENNQDQNLSLFVKRISDNQYSNFIVNIKNFGYWSDQNYTGKIGYLTFDSDLSISKINLNKPLVQLVPDKQITVESRAEYFKNSNSFIYSTGNGNGINNFRVQNSNGKEYNILNLTRFGGHSFEPRMSPDGSKLLFQARSWVGKGLDSNAAYILDINSGEYKIISQSEGFCATTNCIEWPIWLSDQEIIYTKWKNGWPKRDVIKHNITTDKQDIIIDSNDFGIAHLESSADGQLIAFVSWDPKNGESIVMVKNLHSGETLEIINLKKVMLSGFNQPHVYFAWDENKNIICAYSSRANTTLKIMKYDLSGKLIDNIYEIPNQVPFGLDYDIETKEILITHGNGIQYNFNEISQNK